MQAIGLTGGRMNIRYRARRRGEEGVALVTALVILLALTLMGLMMISTMNVESKVAGVEKESAQAMLLAEAGVGKVREWFQYPRRFSPSAGDIANGVSLPAGNFKDCSSLANYSLEPNNMPNCPTRNLTTANAQSFFARRFIANGKFEFINSSDLSQFVALDGGTTKNSNSPVDNPAGGNVPALRITNQTYLDSLFSDFSEIGRVTRLEIYPPFGGGQSLPPRPRTLCTVRITAQTTGGITKTIEAEIKESIFIPVTAGAEAGGMASSWNGSGSIYWGPILAKGNVALNMSNVYKCGATYSKTGKTDPWFKAKIEGTVSTTSGSPDANPCPGSGDACGDCSTAPVNDPAQRPYKDYNVYQNQSVTLDEWKKDDMKSYALDFGYYYKMQTSETACRSNSSGSCVGPAVDVKAILIDANRPPFIYLDASALALKTVELKVTGGDFYTVGDTFVDGAIDMGAGGRGQTINVKDPGGSAQSLTDINFNGVLYMTGELKGSGSPKVFGGVIAEGGMSSSGNPEIWYDIALQSGRRNQPRTAKGGWREIMR